MGTTVKPFSWTLAENLRICRFCSRSRRFLTGSWEAYPAAVAIACLGMVLGAVYMLWMVQRVFWGPLDNPVMQSMPDINAREILVIAPLLVCISWIGIYPSTFLSPMEAAVRLLLAP